MSITGKNHPFWKKIIEMDGAHFPNPWSEKDWEALNLSQHFLLTFGGAQLQGFALFGIVPGDDTAHLLKICLEPSLRGTEAAMKFWDAILWQLKEQGMVRIFLEVALNNGRANGFYKKVGFKDLRIRRSYYSNGDDALTMELTL